MAGRHSSLVPRPHPLTRRNGQVEFLGLAHTVAALSPTNVQKHLCQTRSKKKGMDTQVETITAVREVSR